MEDLFFPDIESFLELTGVLPQQRQDAEDGAGIGFVGDEEVGDPPFGELRVAFVVGVVAAQQADQGIPSRRHLGRKVQQQVGVDGDQARGVLGALLIAADPVDGFSDAGQHLSLLDSLVGCDLPHRKP